VTSDHATYSQVLHLCCDTAPRTNTVHFLARHKAAVDYAVYAVRVTLQSRLIYRNKKTREKTFGRNLCNFSILILDQKSFV
jgi:hypothetical protein